MASVNFSGMSALAQRPPLRRIPLYWDRTERTVVAAVCYRIQPDGDVQFLLVRTRNGRWTFPKGGVDIASDSNAAAAAAREAYEEAGVLGRVEAQSFVAYMHCKRDQFTHPVRAHLCEVLHIRKPMEDYRIPTWFSAQKTKRRLRENRPPVYAAELERVVDGAVHRLGRASRSASRA